MPSSKTSKGLQTPLHGIIFFVCPLICFSVISRGGVGQGWDPTMRRTGLSLLKLPFREKRDAAIFQF